ncbi:MAG: carbohydrate kinase family protein [Thermodesulfobacteriota bacterium]
MKTILGVGALNLDLIYEVKDFKSISSKKVRLDPGKEVFGPGEDFETLLEELNRVGTLKSKSGGGSAANTVHALARMGFQTKFIGKVGEDEEGDFLLKNMNPVDTGFVRRSDRSGICLVVLDRRQDRFLFVSGNANSTLTIDEINLDALKDVSWIHLTSFIGDLPFEAQKSLLGCLELSVKVSLDPGEIYAKKGLDKIRPLIQRSSILFLTEREIRLLTNQDLITGVKSLMEIGPSILVCKRGIQGSCVFTEKEVFEVAALPVKVVDNTGAGDVYNAGFLAGFFLGRHLEEAALFATTIASKSVTKYGREQYPTKEDLYEFFHLTPNS